MTNFTITVTDLEFLARQSDHTVIHRVQLALRKEKRLAFNAYRVLRDPLRVDLIQARAGEESKAQIVVKVPFQGVDFSRLRH